MRNPRIRPCLRAAAVTAALVLSTAPGSAQKASVPCSAFARDTYGGWQVTAPVMLDLGGLLLAPTVGTTFAAGSATHGIEMTAVLDRACGNR